MAPQAPGAMAAHRFSLDVPPCGILPLGVKGLDFGIAFDVNRAAAQCGLWRGTRQTQQRQRRARQRRVGRAVVIGVQRHALAVRFEVHAEWRAIDMHGENLFSETLAEHSRG